MQSVYILLFDLIKWRTEFDILSLRHKARMFYGHDVISRCYVRLAFVTTELARIALIRRRSRKKKKENFSQAIREYEPRSGFHRVVFAARKLRARAFRSSSSPRRNWFLKTWLGFPIFCRFWTGSLTLVILGVTGCFSIPDNRVLSFGAEPLAALSLMRQLNERIWKFKVETSISRRRSPRANCC